MEITDLMLGDWVCVTKNFAQKYHRIRALSNDEEDVLKGIYINDYGVECNSIFSRNDIQSILLTPEILEKNGFLRLDDFTDGRFESFVIDKLGTNENYEIVIGWMDSYDNGASDAFNHVSWDECWNLHCMGGLRSFDMDGGKVIYVHELQHALRLCGIDKEIKL